MSNSGNESSRLQPDEEAKSRIRAAWSQVREAQKLIDEMGVAYDFIAECPECGKQVGIKEPDSGNVTGYCESCGEVMERTEYE